MEFINGFLTWNCVLAVVATAFVTYILFHGRKKEVAELATFKAGSGDAQKFAEVLTKYRDSEEFKAMLEREYLRGKGDGGTEELGNFTIQLHPFARKTGGLVNFVGEYGYQMQLFYRGLPIGDSTERVLEREQKVKTDEVWRLVGAASTAIERIAEIGKKSNIGVEVLKDEKQ